MSGIQLQRSRGILRSRTQERSVRTASCPGLRQPRPQHPAGCAPSWHSAPLGARRRDSSGCSSSGFRALRVQPGTRRAEEATAEGPGKRHETRENRPWRERPGLGLSGSSHHSARPHGSADCPRIWSSGSGSRRSSPPHSNRTCWGKSHRFRICGAGGQGRLQGGDRLPPRPDDSPPATLTRPPAARVQEEGSDRARGHSHATPQVSNPQDHWTGSSDVQMNGGWAQEKGTGQATPAPQVPHQGPAPYCSASLKNW